MNDIATDNAGSLRLQGISNHVIAQGLPEYPDPSMSRANEGCFFFFYLFFFITTWDEDILGHSYLILSRVTYKHRTT